MKPETKKSPHPRPAGTSIKFAILSDPHLYPAKLGTTGSAFEQYLKSQCYKMEAASEAILASAIDSIKNSDVDVVLLPGDMTNNGEAESHTCMIEYLNELIKAGKQVVLINGNHDILNPDAKKYVDNTTKKIDSISPNEFKKQYAQFGYNYANAKDNNSLSYTIDLATDVRLIVIDSCLYNRKNEHHITAGSLSNKQQKWINKQIQDAKNKKMIVLGMMHHGIVPHFSTEPKMFKGFVIEKYDVLQKKFSKRGLQVMFTGHFHSQDIAGQYFEKDRYMLDIETGSLVSDPIPIRFVELTPDRQALKINSQRITDVAYSTPEFKTFADYAKYNQAAGAKQLFLQLATGLFLQQNPNPTDPKQAAIAATNLAATKIEGIPIIDLFQQATKAHYQGDEAIDEKTKERIQLLANSNEPVPKLMGENMLAMAVDTPPVDNNLTIDLRTGKERHTDI